MKGTLITEVRHGGPVNYASFAPDGASILTASSDGRVIRWNSTHGTQEMVYPHFERHERNNPVDKASFSQDGRRILTRGGGIVSVWYTVFGDAPRFNHRPRVSIGDAEFSPEGERVAISYNSSERGGQVFDVIKGVEIGAPMVYAGEEEVARVAWSPDGQKVVTGGSKGTVRVWDAKGLPLTEPLPHEARVLDVSFSPDGRHIVSCSHDKTARLWNAVTGQAIAVLRHEAIVWGVCYSPDGRRVASVSNDGTARIWDPESGTLALAELKHELLAVTCASFSGDGLLFATGSWTGGFGGKIGYGCVWDTATGKEVVSLEHSGSVRSVAFSPDCRMLVTGSGDGTACVWI